jgi:UDP-N-acetylglucosamine 1-carboxyvinyltransferase
VLIFFTIPHPGFTVLNLTSLKGSYMLLDEASVTGTANIVMAAVLAKGITTILQRSM